MQDWTIVFDLDGTLIDTAPDLAAAANHVLSRLSLAPVDGKEIRHFAGHGALAMIDGATRAHGRILTERELHDMFEVFLVHYAENIARSSRPYPGVIAAIDQLEAQGCRFAVCTNKIEAHARLLLEELGLIGRFAALTGRDSVGASKPDPRHLTETIALASGDVSRAIMIGDSDTDIRTARAAGIPIIAVNFGYSTEPVETLGPTAVISHFDELVPLVTKIAGSAVNK